ncbi:MAG: hypothetical protein K2H29_06635 [Oscillospiraceae bacterium]|nr:hypothetical protein [Oscillospiraceae bacterium]
MDLPFSTHRDISFNVQTVSDFIHGNGIETVRTIPELEYQALTSYNTKTLYLVKTESGAVKLYFGGVLLSGDIPAETISELNRVAGVADHHDAVIKTTILPQIAQLHDEIQALEDNIQIMALSQEEYDAIESPDESTLYVIA